MGFDTRTVVVFGDGPGGGNPAPVVLDARGMTDQQMQDVARESGHESAFVLPAPEGSGCDVALRFWVPDHEMEMCGHATVGAIWLMATLGLLEGDDIAVSTLSGIVSARVRRGEGATVDVEISQPRGRVEAVPPVKVVELRGVLGIGSGGLAGREVLNATTSRTKTLVPVPDEAALDALRPDLSRVEQVCADLGSTGLYPYAVVDADEQRFAARQFPRSSGYPEDPATGIAAAALAFGLLHEGLAESDRAVTIHQGRAMGRPSAITVRFELDGSEVAGCWLGGHVELDSSPR